jgi:hypothetical protein
LRNSRQKLSKSWQKTSNNSNLEKDHWRSRISNSSLASLYNENVSSLIQTIKQKAVARTDTGLKHVTHKDKLNSVLYEFMTKVNSDESMALDLKIALSDKVNEIVTSKVESFNHMN